MSTSVRCLLPEYPVIQMTTYGHFSLDDAWVAVNEGASLCRQHGIWNALSEMSGTTHTPPPSAVVKFADELAKRGVPAVYRQAIDWLLAPER